MLYERYEPQDWGDYVGHAAIVARVKALVTAPDFKGGGFLFRGPSGCGKSALARLAAKAFAPHKSQNILLNGDTCTVEAVRDLHARLNAPSMFGARATCITVNECHGLSAQAVKAWLTWFDERPAQSLVIFTTTEPNIFGKGDAPMFSRLLKFNLEGNAATLEAFAKYAQGVAQLENLSGDATFADFVALVKRHNFNLREVLSSIEAGELNSDFGDTELQAA